MKKRLGIIIITAIIALIIPIIFYLFSFNNGISIENDNWGSFGDYLSGTIGVLFSFLSIFLIYLTFTEQRNQQYEYIFNQILSDYSSILNLIKERWLHKASEKVFNEKGELRLDVYGNDIGNPIYQNGREIFGNAVSEISVNDSKKTFIKIFSIHINVFDHYFNFITNSILAISDNNQLKTMVKNDYLKRLCSQFSFYELVFFGYYILYLNENEKIKKIYKDHFLKRLKDFENFSDIDHIDRVKFLIKEIK